MPIAEAMSVPAATQRISGQMQPTCHVAHELHGLGNDVQVQRGDGYFYSAGGEVSGWLDRTVKVTTLSSLTSAQWVEEFERLKKLNKTVLKERPRNLNSPRTTPGLPRRGTFTYSVSNERRDTMAIPVSVRTFETKSHSSP